MCLLHKPNPTLTLELTLALKVALNPVDLFAEAWAKLEKPRTQKSTTRAVAGYHFTQPKDLCTTRVYSSFNLLNICETKQNNTNERRALQKLGSWILNLLRRGGCGLATPTSQFTRKFRLRTSWVNTLFLVLFVLLLRRKVREREQAPSDRTGRGAGVPNVNRDKS